MAAAALALQPIVQAGAESAAENYNADIAMQNATMANNQAAEEERKNRVQSKKQLGDIRASYGSSGVNIDGSALDVLEESAANAELDSLQIKHGGQVKARAYENEANLDRFRAKNAKVAGYFGAASSVLNSGSKIAAGGMG